MKFKDFFASTKTQTETQKEDDRFDKSVVLDEEYETYFRNNFDDYSKDANIKVFVRYADPYFKHLGSTQIKKIYGPEEFDQVDVILYKNKKNHMISVWGDKIFKDQDYVGTMKPLPPDYVINLTHYAYEYEPIIYNNLDQY